MDARQLLAELKSRGVSRVAAVYCAGAWALLQVADLIFPMLGLPDGSVTAVLVVAAAGFPFALALAWWFDLTPGGIASAPPLGEVSPGKRLSVVQVAELLLIAALTLLVGYLYVDRLTPEAGDGGPRIPEELQGRPSIAVMPFLNLSDSQDMGYLGDGLAEEILNLLARLSELNVTARTSSFYFRDKEVDFREIATRLGVGHILEGSVRRQGEQVRVTAQLIETGSGFQVWSDAYDRDIGGLLELQEDIARNVVDSLQLVLSERSDRALQRDYDIDPLAYDYYLRGRDYLRKPVDGANLQAGVDFFRRAIDVDRDFADAWAGLCDGLLGLYEATRDTATYREGETACRRALEIDADAVSVYIAQGNLYRISGEHEAALAALDRALELNPSAVDAYRERGKTLEAMGRRKAAVEDLEKAIRLQPNYWRAQNDLAALYFGNGDYEQAIPLWQNVANLNPASETVFNNLGSALYMVGKPNEAAEAWEQSVALNPSAISLSNLAGSLFFAGRFEEAAAKFRQAARLAPKDFQYRGFLAESLRAIPGREAEADAAFARAIDLARSQLDVNPGNGDARVMLASYLARTGDRESALAMLDDAPGPGDCAPQACYYRAIALTALGQPSEALAALERAVAMGYPTRLLALDENFRELRQMPRFAGLTAMDDAAANPASREEASDEGD